MAYQSRVSTPNLSHALSHGEAQVCARGTCVPPPAKAHTHGTATSSSHTLPTHTRTRNQLPRGCTYTSGRPISCGYSDVYIFCIQCIHYVYRILNLSLGSLACCQAAPPLSRGSSTHGLGLPQLPRPFLPHGRTFYGPYEWTNVLGCGRKAKLALCDEGRRAALPARALIAFARALCTGAS